MKASLRVEDVAVRLDERPVLRGVDLCVRPGEVLGLLGRNGAGKSTLLRTATGVIPLERGAIQLLERPLAAWPRRELARRVAVVPQETRFPFPFRVLEVVLMGRAPHLGWLGFEGAHDVALARRALARLGIEALAERSVLELSGGERQLVVVARALAQEPALLLLDEPTAFLDLRHRVEVLRVVRGLADEGRAALVVSHDLALAARFCDRLALLVEGRVLAVGAPSEVLTPEQVERTFDVRVRVAAGPDGAPLVVPC